MDRKTSLKILDEHYQPAFCQARNFTLIVQYWLVPGTDLRVI